MKPLFTSSLFAFALAACLDTPVEPPPPVSSPAPDDTADRGGESSFDDSIFYCVEAWENDGVCIRISTRIAHSYDLCIQNCQQHGYANPTCDYADFYDGCGF